MLLLELSGCVGQRAASQPSQQLSPARADQAGELQRLWRGTQRLLGLHHLLPTRAAGEQLLQDRAIRGSKGSCSPRPPVSLHAGCL